MDVQVTQQTSVALSGEVQLVAGKRQWQAGELEAGAAQATSLVLLPGKGLWFLTFGLSGPEVYTYGEKGDPFPCGGRGNLKAPLELQSGGVSPCVSACTRRSRIATVACCVGGM